ncbi:MAG: glycine oxidase ThiO [Capsulimonadaceae bacterium]
MADYSTDVAVIGGGVIGLSIAYRLAVEGRAVTVIDAGKRGQASRAAAGMLAPLAESNSLPALTEIGVPSLRSYPKYLRDISNNSGIPIALHGPGILRVATTDEEAQELCNSVDRQSQSGFPVFQLSQSEMRDMEPEIGAQLLVGVLSPAEKHIPPYLLTHALRAACELLGVRLLSRTEVTDLRQRGTGWEMMIPGGGIVSEVLIAAAGVWTRELLGRLELDVPVTPLKGQILSVCFSPNEVTEVSHRKSSFRPWSDAVQPFTHTIYAHGTYLVPRPSREIVIGATEEPEAGFDTGSTSEAIASLRMRANRLVPALADASLTEATAGLRPASPDRLPIIGKIPGYSNGFVASGHGRNGILLAPFTSDLISDMVLYDAPPPASVDPARFLAAG